MDAVARVLAGEPAEFRPTGNSQQDLPKLTELSNLLAATRRGGHRQYRWQRAADLLLRA